MIQEPCWARPPADKSRGVDDILVASSVIASGEPYSVLMLRDAISMLHFRTLSEDQREAQRNEADFKFIAWTLASCDFGLGCRKSDTSALRMCADFGACGVNLEEGVLKDLPAEQGRRVQEERLRMAAAMRDRNIRALLP